jgi:DNA-binding NarL/FixJ family response regulator
MKFGDRDPGCSPSGRVSVSEVPYRVLVIDDHPIFRGGVIAVLHTIFGSVEAIETETLAAAIAEIRCGRPFDLILLDLFLPDAKGAEGVSGLVTEAPSVPVVVITESDNPRHMHDTIAAGARGYILKSSTIRALKPALLLVLSEGNNIFAPSGIFTAANS